MDVRLPYRSPNCGCNLLLGLLIFILGFKSTIPASLFIWCYCNTIARHSYTIVLTIVL